MCDARELNPANGEDQYLLCGPAVCAGNEDLVVHVLVDVVS